MKATVLIDNITKNDLINEWGLAILIEYDGHQILLDTGASPKFVSNAENLGFDLSDVEYGVLSHGHYDHGNGLEGFFEKNQKAKFYFRKGVAENIYTKEKNVYKYEGLKKGYISKYRDRIMYVDGNFEIMPGVNLLPHSTPNIAAIGEKNHMYIWQDGRWHADDLAHEQSLVFHTEKGLVIFNSCSHAGADNIIREAESAFPKEKLYAIIGGFHLFETSEEDVRKLAKGIEATGIEMVYTGHCTGTKAFKILQDELGDKVRGLYTGLVMEI